MLHEKEWRGRPRQSKYPSWPLPRQSHGVKLRGRTVGRSKDLWTSCGVLALHSASSMENSAEKGGVHPLLRGGRPPHRHGYSPAQMEALAAICDTFVPSITPEMRARYENAATRGAGQEVDEFYRLSGSQNGVPDHVAGLIAKQMTPLGAYAAWAVLWLLSTRLGTFLLCGRDSACSGFPYLQKFSRVSQANREKILLGWSQGRGSVLDFPFKLIFRLFKSVCLFTFYSKADASGSNPAWKAIGYRPPDLPACAPRERPLEKGVIDVSSVGEKLPKLLRDAGFPVAKERARMRVQCDAVVVGSGAGGGVAAAELARAGYRVLVLEKGKYYAGEQLSLLEGPSMDQMHEAGGVLMTENGNVMLLAGSTVGGGTAVNWSAAIRTPPGVLREWAEDRGLTLFRRDEYREAMDAVCARLGVQDACEKESFQNSILRKGCAKLGYAVESVPRNAPPDHFCGSCHFGCRNGAKRGTDQTWLADAVAANALILAGCAATSVVLVAEPKGGRKRRAVGVVARLGEAEEGDLLVEARATVVACGALFTPALLRASGLRNPNIGENLHLHLSRLAWGYFPAGEWPEGACYEGGILTSMSRWERSGRGMALQTPAFFPGNFSVAMPWVSGIDMKQRMLRFSRTAHVYAMTRDSGGGRVHAGKRNSFSYKFARADKENLAHGLERAVRALIAAGAVEVGTHQKEGERFRVRGAADEEIEDFLARTRARELDEKRADVDTVTSTAHQMGSCRMGIDPKTSAVDEKGEAWEARGLFVCDASVFPSALGVNPMITVQASAVCISTAVVHFLREASPSPKLNPGS